MMRGVGSLMILLTVLAIGVLATANADRPLATAYIEKFEVPERDEHGNLKWKLTGDKAQIREDGLMTVLNVRAEFFSSNRVDLVFTAPVCTLDRVKKRASTDAPIRLERQNIVVTGQGGDWTAADNSFVVRSNVQVVISGQIAKSIQIGIPNDEAVPNTTQP